MPGEQTIMWAVIDHVEGPELPPLECEECGNRARVLAATLHPCMLNGAILVTSQPLCLVHAKHDRKFRRRVHHLDELRKEHQR